MSQSSLLSTQKLLALAILSALGHSATLRAENATIATIAASDANDALDANEASEGRQPSALEEITVQAQRSTLEMARAAEEAAPNIINLMTAMEIQKLPDVNTGEAIRRVPGISLETDTGEGRYINIRGLDADLNSTTFGGLRLPPTNNSSPSGAGRAVAFDSIPIGFVGAIKVTKSNLPEQDAEALGGTIDITPKTAPPGAKPFADLRLGTGRNPCVTRISRTWRAPRACVLAAPATTSPSACWSPPPCTTIAAASTMLRPAFIDNQAAGSRQGLCGV